MADTPTWIQAFTAIAQSAIALAAFVLSWVLWHNSRRHARADYNRTIQESWNQLDSLVLQNPKLPSIADDLFGVTGIASDEARLKRYLAFFALNILQATFLGQQVGLVEDAYHLEGALHVLDPMLRDPEITDLIKFGGYHPDFVAFCDERRGKLPSFGISGTRLPRS
jgi:hypothetical protein